MYGRFIRRSATRVGALVISMMLFLALPASAAEWGGFVSCNGEPHTQSGSSLNATHRHTVNGQDHTSTNTTFKSRIWFTVSGGFTWIIYVSNNHVGHAASCS